MKVLFGSIMASSLGLVLYWCIDYHYILQDKTNIWTVYGPTAFIKQHDGNSCGPIACLKLLDVFGCIPDSITSLDALSGTQLRRVVMDCYDSVRNEIEDDIKLVNKTRKRKDAPGSTARDDDEEPVDLITPEKKKHKKEDSEVDTARKAAISKKKEFRAEQAKKMARQYDRNVQRRIAKVGDIVRIGIDKRDIPGAHGIQAICFQRAEEGGGILAATTMGIIATSKKPFWIPLERYGVLVDTAPLSTEMRMLRVSILQGTYEHLNQPMVTLQEVHRQLYETREDSGNEEEKEKESVTCKCKKKCGKRCGCIKKSKGCSSNCGCGDKCGNPFNELERGQI